MLFRSGVAFLKANLTPAPDKGELAFTTTSGQTVFARALDGCVALAPTAATLPAALPAKGVSERFRAQLKADELAWLDRADIVAWGSRAASSTPRRRRPSRPSARPNR